MDHFVKHLVHYRAIKSNLGCYKPRSPFWGDTCNAHLLQATIYWCMVFGSHERNQSHWKNLAAGDAEELLKSFRAGLYVALGVSESEWTSNWKEMVAFRDKFAAHRELNFGRPVPVIDLALASAFYYDEWVRKVIHPDELDELPLRQLVEGLQTKITAEVVAALEATTAEPALQRTRRKQRAAEGRQWASDD
ncbi:MAG: hypothetical protein ACREJ4_04990 [Candidatus Methylomirabilaceae bacterium]